MKTFSTSVLAILVLISQMAVASAADGLIIHSAEFGVGKFHRQDNKVHPYNGQNALNAWTPYILPDDADSSKPLVINNTDGSVTVFFSTLDDLLSSVVQISASRHQKVSVLNIHGHGLPGAMWFPNNADALGSWGCSDWVQAAQGSDEDNYSQYYSAVSPSEIREIRDSSADTDSHMSCTTGLTEWQDAVAKNTALKTALASDIQIHFLSCVVGLGAAGEQFTQGIAALLLPANSKGRVETSTNFGLGDWSMPEGMGFWDLQTDAQVDHDNEIYVVDHKDREIAQPGTVRMVTYANGGFNSTLLANTNFLSLRFESDISGTPVSETTADRFEFQSRKLPSGARIRVPGTSAYVNVK